MKILNTPPHITPEAHYKQVRKLKLSLIEARTIIFSSTVGYGDKKSFIANKNNP